MINKAKKKEKQALQDIDTVENSEAKDEAVTAADEPTVEDNGDSLQKLLEESEKKCGEYVDQLQRLAAEFDNFRKRTAKEKTSMYSDGCRDTIAKLLPVIDNFERAMPDTDVNSESGETDPFYKGMQMIFKQLIGVMTELDVKEIPALGLTFNTDVHFAVAHEDNDAAGESEVVEVMQKGYICKDKVLRHSMVKVAN